MILVFECHKAERLQDAVAHLPRGAEDFGHPVHRSRLRLESDFDEVALSQRLGQAQEATCDGNGLEFCFRAATVFKPDGSQNRIS